ncbi:MAG: helix-turn-helix transcriptional regulator [Treponema sp.]|nr:helix-turn-helix transcriptional regulator [Treponema sp.]
MSFYTRYAECCKQKNIAPVSQEAADKLGCSKSNISFLARNGNMPKGEIVAGAAKMLNVSADYLLELTDLPAPLQSDGDISASLQAALLLFRELNPDGQTAALAMLKGLSLQDTFKA